MEQDSKLEESLGKRLKALPDLEAPDNLISGVLAIIQARSALGWWQRPWNQWPPRAQLASCTWLAVVAAVLYWGVQGWERLPEVQSSADASGALGLLTSFWGFAFALVQTIGTLIAAFRPMLVIGTVLVCVFYLACIGVGSACLRASFQRRGTP